MRHYALRDHFITNIPALVATQTQPPLCSMPISDAGPAGRCKKRIKYGVEGLVPKPWLNIVTDPPLPTYRAL